jgi:hypothetical protein
MKRISYRSSAMALSSEAPSHCGMCPASLHAFRNGQCISLSSRGLTERNDDQRTVAIWVKCYCDRSIPCDLRRSDDPNRHAVAPTSKSKRTLDRLFSGCPYSVFRWPGSAKATAEPAWANSEENSSHPIATNPKKIAVFIRVPVNSSFRGSIFNGICRLFNLH